MYYLARQGGYASKNVHCPALHAVFINESDIAIFHLDGDWNQHCIPGHSHKISTHIKRHQIHADLVTDHFLQVFELHRRRFLQLIKLLQAVKLLALLILSKRAGPQPLEAAASKAIRLARHAHLLVKSQPRIGGIKQQCIFLAAIHGHVVVAAHAGVDKLDDHFLTDIFQVAITPVLKRVSGSLTAPFVHGTLVRPAGRMRFNLIRRPIHNVDSASVGFPARDSGSEMFVRVCHTPVVFFLEFVFDCVGSRVAALPEGFDELVALFVIRKQLEGFLFLVRDNPADVFVEPFLISLAQLYFQ